MKDRGKMMTPGRWPLDSGQGHARECWESLKVCRRALVQRQDDSDHVRRGPLTFFEGKWRNFILM
jgi:hypothetical protein